MQGLKFRGRPPILIAGSVKDIVSGKNEYVKTIMDRSQPTDDEFVGAIAGQSVMTWESRNPRPALNQDGNFQCTDLDLLSFLVPIAARGAVIEIPHYCNRRKIVRKAGERKVGANQFGPITGLISNKNVLSFSVRIHDKTIVKENYRTEEEKIGAHRNYMIVDCDGHWYHGWDKIVWHPTAAENRFLNENRLWTGNTLRFRNYVHPNRWQSIFSSQHLLKKWLISRIDDEAEFYRSEMKRLKAGGISPSSREIRPRPLVISEGPTVPIVVKTIEMVLDIPEFEGTYLSVPHTKEGLLAAYKRQKHLTFTLKPWIQFMVRANEAAYFWHGDVDGAQKIASWMEGRTWNRGWKTPGGRAEWNQMILSPEVALRYRVKSVTQRVSAR